MEESPTWKGKRFSAIQGIRSFYWTGLFITSFTRPHQLSLFWVKSIQYMNSPPIAFPGDPFQYYPPIYAWVFQVVSFSQVFPPKPLYISDPPTRATWTAMTFFLICSPEQYLVSSTDYNAPHYAVLSTPLLSHPSDTIFYTTPYSQTSSAYVSASMLVTTFHTHTK
jgi:hypothetical protein